MTRAPLNQTPRTLRAAAGRWPAPRRRGDPQPEHTPAPEDIAATAPGPGDLRELIDLLRPVPVLGSQTYLLNSAGQAAEQYRRPFAALAIISASASQLTLMADTAKGAAATSGPGVAIIPARGFVVANMRGFAWSLYGGNSGDAVYVQAFTRPMPPQAASGLVAVANTVLSPIPVTVQNAVAAAVPVAPVSDYPSGAVAITAASGNVANAAAVATLAAAAAKTTYITGFECTASGSTGVLIVLVTVANVVTGTLTYVFVFPAGVTTPATPLVVEFPKPIPANAQNTAITVTLPAGGAGNTNAAVVAHGYQL